MGNNSTIRIEAVGKDLTILKVFLFSSYIFYFWVLFLATVMIVNKGYQISVYTLLQTNPKAMLFLHIKLV